MTLKRRKKTVKRKPTKKKLSRNGQLIRALLILKGLVYHKRPTSVPKLAVKYGVHQKTIRRDLKALEGAGFKMKKTWQEGKTTPLISLRAKSPRI